MKRKPYKELFRNNLNNRINKFIAKCTSRPNNNLQFLSELEQNIQNKKLTEQQGIHKFSLYEVKNHQNNDQESEKALSIACLRVLKSEEARGPRAFMASLPKLQHQHSCLVLEA
jgi:adenylyl- and sulfurtransferase ThiI